jgi:cyclase
MISRRDFLAGSTLGLASGLVARPALVGAWQQAPAPPAPPLVTPVFTAIRRNVGFFTGRGGTIGYLIDPAGVGVVDSQFPDAAKLCLDGLNERSKNRAIDLLVNTHHHDDHTLGNTVFKPSATKILAHAKAAEHMKSRPGRGPAASEQTFPTATFTDVWRQQVGDEWMAARYYGAAHTSGDAVVTFERANVVHMGDLMFNRRQPVVDKPAGADFKNWIVVLEKTASAHNNDTVYIFGHAGMNLPVTGSRADLMVMRDFLTALLTFVQGEIKAGKTRDQIIAIRTPVPGFDSHGNLGQQALEAAFDELSGK